MLSEQRLRRWLREARDGRRTIGQIVDALKHLPVDRAGAVRLDTHRRLRRGLPEVILCEGKTPDQLLRIARRLIALRELALLTRLDPAVAQLL